MSIPVSLIPPPPNQTPPRLEQAATQASQLPLRDSPDLCLRLVYKAPWTQTELNFPAQARAPPALCPQLTVPQTLTVLLFLPPLTATPS